MTDKATDQQLPRIGREVFGAWIEQRSDGIVTVRYLPHAVMDAQAAQRQMAAINAIANGRPLQLIIQPSLAKEMTPEAREVLLSAQSLTPMPRGIALVAENAFWRVAAKLFAPAMRIHTRCDVFATVEEAAVWLNGLVDEHEPPPMRSIVASRRCELGQVELWDSQVVVLRVMDNKTISAQAADEALAAAVELLGGHKAAPMICVVRWPILTPGALSALVERRGGGPAPDCCLAFVAGTSYARLIGRTALRHYEPHAPTQVFAEMSDAFSWCTSKRAERRRLEAAMAPKTG